LQVTAEGVVVEFDLLEKYSTDPPNVHSLSDATEFFLTNKQLTVR
jgi:hypothetical protein